MTNQIKLILLVMLCGTFGSAKASLFSDSTCIDRIEDLEQSTPWLGSNNAAGLSALSSSFSQATVFVQKQNGKFVNYSESDNSFTWGAKAAAYLRVHPRIALSGLIEYSHFTGKHMGGSAFMNPEQNPFDIVDFDVDNRGKKQKEIYHLNGAASYDFTKHWTLGAKVDYTAGNYAKQKDLRHTNELMNICTTIGALYHTKRWDIGANYLFRKRNEGLFFKTYGTTEEVYNSLISYGGFWGVVEQFGVIGYTDKNEQKPLIDTYHGGALQFNWKPTAAISFYNEIEVLFRKGSYGIPGTRKITYCNHNGNVLNYTGQLNVQAKRGKHLIRWTYQQSQLNNDENIFRYEPGPGGLDEIKYFGSLETLKKKVRCIGIDYTGNLGALGKAPVWTLKGGCVYHHRDVKASFFPFFRKQNFHYSTIHFSSEYHLRRTDDVFHFLLGTQLTTGDGTPADDGFYTTPSDNQKPPKSVPQYLNHEFEYLTATQMRHQVGFEYQRKIKYAKVWTFGSLNYIFAHAFDTQYIKNAHQHTLFLRLGCTF